jgi:hypothetical protein
MTPDTPIAAARPDVIDEVFDGEAVLVHLRTGFYYALSPAGTALWRLLAPGRSPAAVAAGVAAATGRSEEEARAELTAFAAALVAEQLAVPAEQAAPALDAAQLRDLPAGEPTLQRFDDMQDLLMLDPIHDLDLDGDGWPVGRDGTPVEPAP